MVVGPQKKTSSSSWWGAAGGVLFAKILEERREEGMGERLHLLLTSPPGGGTAAAPPPLPPRGSCSASVNSLFFCHPAASHRHPTDTYNSTTKTNTQPATAAMGNRARRGVIEF